MSRLDDDVAAVIAAHLHEQDPRWEWEVTIAPEAVEHPLVEASPVEAGGDDT